MRKVALALFALGLFTTVALAQEQPKQEHANLQKEMYEKWMKAATPGDAHKKLADLNGTWDAKVRTWMQPGQPPMESVGTAVNTTILGGRFMQQNFTGTFMGMPYSGVGLMGYDNTKGQYQATWIDNMGTGFTNLTGTATANGYDFKGTTPDPISGKDAMMEEKWIIADADHHTFEIWGAAPDGSMYKMMEVAYSRKK